MKMMIKHQIIVESSSSFSYTVVVIMIVHVILMFVSAVIINTVSMF